IAANGRHVAQQGRPHPHRRFLRRQGDRLQRLDIFHDALRILHADDVRVAGRRMDPEVRRELGARHQRGDDVAHHVGLRQLPIGLRLMVATSRSKGARIRTDAFSGVKGTVSSVWIFSTTLSGYCTPMMYGLPVAGWIQKFGASWALDISEVMTLRTTSVCVSF